MSRIWKITWFGILFVLVMLFWIFVIGIRASEPGSFYNKGHNAVWLEHKWVGEKSSDQEVSKLVNNLKAHGIDTVFVHSGPFESDGTVDPERYKYAVDFLDRARRFSDGIEYQAWLGQVRSNIDLSDESVRMNIADQCILFAQIIDFDGIHFDIEPVWDGDSDFTEVLAGCREVLPDGKKISVAMSEMIPGAFLWPIKQFKTLDNYNTEENYEAVAEYADQIVMMIFDTSFDSKWLYRWSVSEEVIRATDLLEGKEFFVGLPAYHYDEDDLISLDVESVEDITWFDPEVENLANGLKGVIDGLNNIRSSEENFAGVAIYRYEEISEEEWDEYRELWME